MQSRGKNAGFLRECLMLSTGKPASLSRLPRCTVAHTGMRSPHTRTPCRKHTFAEQHLSSPEGPGILGQAKASGAWMPTAWPGGQSHSDVPCMDGCRDGPWLLFIQSHVVVWWLVSSPVQGPWVSMERPHSGTELQSQKMSQSHVLDCL